MSEWSFPDGETYDETGSQPPGAMSDAEYRRRIERGTYGVELALDPIRTAAIAGGLPGAPALGEAARRNELAPAPTETVKPDGWWFCNPPTVEEVRFKLDAATGAVVAAVCRCEHGAWDNLSDARAAHLIKETT